MGFYDDKILPHVLGAVMRLGDGDPVLERQATGVFSGAEGDVLEVGIGQGRTLPLYDKAKVRSVVGLEPSAGMRKHAIEAAAEAPVTVEVVDGDAQKHGFRSRELRHRPVDLHDVLDPRSPRGPHERCQVVNARHEGPHSGLT